MKDLKEEFEKKFCFKFNRHDGETVTEILGWATMPKKVFNWFSKKLTAEREKSASFEQQLSDVLNAYKIDMDKHFTLGQEAMREEMQGTHKGQLINERRKALDDAIGICDWCAQLTKKYTGHNVQSLSAVAIRTHLQAERDKI